ncbi:MAG TPA: undecaprenyldiphospho-muramoylpentapeptide beta-N-acetylglucosaminyltransferase [Stellaceae bacterium]|nr:undecaprenyldiphospho-muramoylpentapeptide beta-N-acetylglucosaminyltransferase [Stellaceae bacterium]
MSGPVVIAAGGTGGHLFPAEALAAELTRRGERVEFVTDARSEAFAERLAGVAVHRVRAGRPQGGPWRAARGLAELARGTVAARRLLRRLGPRVVVGFGGYPSLPAMLAAASVGLPVVIHEQNAVLGRANRLLAGWARAIATAFPETIGLRPRDRARASHTGNPVRPSILARAAAPYAPPAAAGAIELLVIGGSQGARVLSEVVPAALAMLPEGLRRRLQVVQQARPEDRAGVAEAYRASAIAAETESFFRDMPERLERAHLVISRAGASTIAELSAIGRPALLVPYPHATDDHQSENARAFAAAGGGWVVAQRELTAVGLAHRLESLLGDGDGLAMAARRARQFGRRDAVQLLASLALSVAPPAGCAAPGRERAA